MYDDIVSILIVCVVTNGPLGHAREFILIKIHIFDIKTYLNRYYFVCKCTRESVMSTEVIKSI